MFILLFWFSLPLFKDMFFVSFGLSRRGHIDLFVFMYVFGCIEMCLFVAIFKEFRSSLIVDFISFCASSRVFFVISLSILSSYVLV